MKAILTAAAVTSAVLLGATTLAQAAPLLWESSFGSDLGLTDDSTALWSFGTMSFSFAGTTYTGASVLAVSSNGFISLGGDNDDDCCSGNAGELTGDVFARIAPLWADVDPSTSGAVYLNSFNDDVDAAIDRIVVTWDTVLYDNGLPVTFQLQLLENGTIIFGYDGLDLAGGFDDDTLIGLSPAGGVADPGSTDLSSGTPFSTGAEPTIYELFTGSPPAIDIDQSNLVFTPNGQGGWIVNAELNAVPEAGALGLLGLGLAGLGIAARRRKAA
jgi:hypothetical protein